jgi:hypothetical protein
MQESGPSDVRGQRSAKRDTHVAEIKALLDQHLEFGAIPAALEDYSERPNAMTITAKKSRP